MRFVAPARREVDPVVFERPPLSLWREFAELLHRSDWPTIAALDEFAGAHPEGALNRSTAPRFVEQTRELLGDGLHYEQRIAERGQIATRVHNWHDLFNALVWLRFPEVKSALNARQFAEIAVAGAKARTRAQCALTHFDEAGVIVVLRDRSLLPLWDAHDWHGLFWRERAAWRDRRIEAIVFGHALLEHALQPAQLLVGKALVVLRPDTADANADESSVMADAFATCTDAIGRSELLNDPQELRPLPLSGIPGWHVDNGGERFYRETPCFCPLRAGRRYPAPLHGPGAGVQDQNGFPLSRE